MHLGMNPVLEFFLEEPGYVSGESIAEKLGFSRAAVWKHIQTLTERGFVFDSAPKKGYKLISIPPGPLIPEIIKHQTKENFTAEIIILPQTDSTNTQAKKLLLNKKNTDFVLATEEQTQGRGRLSRVWKSEAEKDLLFSICLSLNEPVSEFYKYTIIASLSVFQALQGILQNHDFIIKWPNDLYAGNKKICGILSEMVTEGLTITSMIIGIGINVNSMPPIDTSTAIKSLTGNEAERNQLLSAVLNRFFYNLKLLRNGRFPELFNQWKENMGWIGKPIKIDTGREVVSGTLLGVNQDGSIVIMTSNGERVFYSGDLSV